MNDKAALSDSSKSSVHPPASGPIRPIPSDFLDDVENDPEGNPHFDPHTLAHLAALSRIVGDERSEIDANDENTAETGSDFSALLTGRVTSDQVQGFVDGLASQDEDQVEQTQDGHDKLKQIDKAGPEQEDPDVNEDENGGGSRASSDGSRSEDEDGQTKDSSDPRYVYEKGRLKRKRNRTTLSVAPFWRVIVT